MIGHRIKLVRELDHTTQEQLEKLSGVQQSVISYLEAGRMETAPTGVVEAIANATGFPVEFFYADGVNVSRGSLELRALSRVPKKTITRNYRAMQLALEVAVHADQDSPLQVPVRIGTLSVPTTQDEIEAAARSARQMLRIGAETDITNLTRDCEHAGILTVPLADAIDESDKIEGHFGASLWAPDARPIIAFSPDDPGDRQRFTIAHELGHLLFHCSGEHSDDDAESTANRFAGALLLPEEPARELLEGGPTLSELMVIKKNWGLSMAALIARGAALGVIDPARKVSLYKQLAARKWRKTEPVPVPREEPLLLLRLLEAKYGRPLDLNAAARAAHLRPSALAQMIRTQPGATSPPGGAEVIPIGRGRRGKSADQQAAL